MSAHKVNGIGGLLQGRRIKIYGETICWLINHHRRIQSNTRFGSVTCACVYPHPYPYPAMRATGT